MTIHRPHMPFLERQMLYTAGHAEDAIDAMAESGTRPDGWVYPPTDPRDLPAITPAQAFERLHLERADADGAGGAA